MIRMENLTRTFGEVVAVEGLTLEVDEGEVFGFIGPNGAGKTTTTRMLCCLIKPTYGTAFVKGNEIGKEPDALNIRRIVGLLPEAPGLYERLSSYKNLDFFAQLYDVPAVKRRERIKELLEMLGMWKRRDEPVNTFSKGMKQKIAISRALVHDPEILFLDEPTAGLDPRAAKTVRDFLSELKQEGRTIFLNTHNLVEAERLCDRVGVINTKLIAIGSPKELKERFWGRTTVVQLKKLSPNVVAAVKALPFAKNVRTEDNSLLIDLAKPEDENSEVAEVIIRSGGEIQFMSELKHTLEEVYLELIGG
ncbi:MAG: ABC transporter ATP-binding protein [Methanomassiliicoccales archaeon]|nr:MAG: ABC transporter ATP-binding protein [Methanomassiliicoccales archaeon]